MTTDGLNRRQEMVGQYGSSSQVRTVDADESRVTEPGIQANENYGDGV